jgi:hypothetical protein
MPRKPQNEKDKLKLEISKRWAKIREDYETTDSTLRGSIAFAQLEYILETNGLLSQPRNRSKKPADESQTALTL